MKGTLVYEIIGAGSSSFQSISHSNVLPDSFRLSNVENVYQNWMYL